MRVIGLGAGGHAKVVIEILRLSGNYEIAGLLDHEPELWNTEVAGVPVLGGDDLLPEIYARGIHCAFIGVGTIGVTEARRRLYDKVRHHGFELARAVHPQAVISPSAEIGDGPTIMAGVVINAAARLGDNVIVNTGATIDHDCVIGSHVHISCGASLGGSVTVGEASHVGIGASLIQSIHVGRSAVIGAGSVVISDIPDGVVAVGVPARILKRTEG